MTIVYLLKKTAIGACVCLCTLLGISSASAMKETQLWEFFHRFLTEDAPKDIEVRDYKKPLKEIFGNMTIEEISIQLFGDRFMMSMISEAGASQDQGNGSCLNNTIESETIFPVLALTETQKEKNNQKCHHYLHDLNIRFENTKVVEDNKNTSNNKLDLNLGENPNAVVSLTGSEKKNRDKCKRSLCDVLIEFKSITKFENNSGQKAIVFTISEECKGDFKKWLWDESELFHFKQWKKEIAKINDQLTRGLFLCQLSYDSGMPIRPEHLKGEWMSRVTRFSFGAIEVTMKRIPDIEWLMDVLKKCPKCKEFNLLSHNIFNDDCWYLRPFEFLNSGLLKQLQFMQIKKLGLCFRMYRSVWSDIKKYKSPPNVYPLKFWRELEDVELVFEMSLYWAPTLFVGDLFVGDYTFNDGNKLKTESYKKHLELDFSQCLFLKKLTIYAPDARFTEEILATIPNNSLEELELHFTVKDETDFSWLARFKNLKVLRLWLYKYDVWQLKFKGLTNPKLEKLVICMDSHCSKGRSINIERFNFLKGLKNLKKLTLGNICFKKPEDFYNLLENMKEKGISLKKLLLTNQVLDRDITSETNESILREIYIPEDCIIKNTFKNEGKNSFVGEE